MATLYRPSEIAAVARAGDLCAQILTEAAAAATQGATGAAIDTLVRQRLAEAGAEPVLPELTGPAGPFPGAISVSTGPSIANAPPGAEAPPPGAIVRLDLACRLDGWIADAATSVVVGLPAGPAAGAAEPVADHLAEARRLLAAARAVTGAATRALRPGARWTDVLQAGHAAAASAGVHIPDWPWGHGVGRRLHEPPALPADPANPAAAFTLRPGMVLAIEPIILSRPAHLHIAPDGWALTAADPGVPPLAACEERTVAVGEPAPRILTPLP